MKKILLLVVLILVLLAGCSGEPDFVDNGQPGTIRVVVYNDLNENDFKDEGEVLAGEQVGISQEGACPVSTREQATTMETTDTGEAIFEGLTPGKYCVMYMDSARARTKLTYEVFLSSEEVLSVGFAVIRD